MRNRDKAILNNLKRFRCMSRDDIIDLHFQGLKNAVTCCNTVMKRLRRDGHVDANISQQPYIYFPQSSTLRKTSQKIPHFLGIVDVYKQLLYYEKPKLFKVEPKYGKEFMEPDAFTIWRRSPFFIEVQRSVYSKKVMQDKINRYELYFHSQEWHNESWQPKESKYFPSILIITEKYYNISSFSLRIFQASSISNFLNSLVVKAQ
ncbi:MULTISPECIES: replication-relaxation family protein [Bacillus cereus group]|uniref:Replication-relaxation n=1 Tax=Bacillus thuringiensis serovar iberica TaxID=180866 RepID=A0A9X6QTI3_BACTU|nr:MULTISPECIES: replication-relaxation family protein [Bacillus cereus group]HDR5353085.1 replication-relaxation family protein [Bacillus thuringiensis]MBY0133968.1 replication-relaxation family protein [Bacillus cereus]MCJ0850146.1 replication-relaxation family protein [Bacillus cereus]MCU5646431.1 replication-relaxation family protein [Bacillus cereus]MDA2051497.1 replication-relaxation family protein [Bacillus cereus]